VKEVVVTNSGLRLFVVGAALACTAAVIGAPRLAVPSAIATVTPSTFHSRVTRYLTMRHNVIDGVLQHVSNASEDGEAFRLAVAAGLQEARRNAQPGDLLGAELVERVVAAVRLDMARRDYDDRRAVLAEVPPAGVVRVNDRYPDGQPLATVPPLLLQRLEPLPDELQYRFLGTALVVLDVDTAVIVDVVPHVIGGTT
jgi:hypothetical protein